MAVAMAATGLPEPGADISRAERPATCSTSGRRHFLPGVGKKTPSLEFQREVQWLSPVSSSWEQPHYSRKMDPEGLKPDAELFAQVALAGARSGDLQACKQLYLRALSTGLDSHPLVGSALIRMYASSRGSLVDDPGELFTVAGTDVYAWTSVITSAGQRSGRRAIEVFQAMDMNGVKPDSVTYAAVLGICTKLRDLQQGRKIHERIVAESLEMDTNLGIHLISMYSATSCIPEAGRVFRLLRHRPDPVLWTSLITSYVKHGWMSEAVEVFKQMDLEGVKPNAITFTTILPACSLAEGARLHSRAAAEAMGSNFRLATALISMYAGHGTCSAGQP